MKKITDRLPERSCPECEGNIPKGNKHHCMTCFEKSKEKGLINEQGLHKEDKTAIDIFNEDD